MGLFDKLKKPSASQENSWTAPEQAATRSHEGGLINLTKGSGISLVKTPTITASCSWASSTDYDVYALVVYTDGHTETVATFGAKGVPARTSTRDRAVVHQGDVGRDAGASGLAHETIEVSLNPQIAMVVPVVYSAQSNGSGSFHRYRVSMAVDNGAGQRVEIDATNASDDDNVYSCVPGVIVNSENGVQVYNVELYSERNSENRPDVAGGTVTMDAGPRNDYK